MKRIFTFILVLLVTSFGIAQSTSDTNYSAEVFSSEQEARNLLSGLFTNQPAANNFDSSQLLVRNEVILKQIGIQNYASVQSTSNASSINLIQNGNFNRLDINITAPTITENIIQNGNNNNVLDNIYYSNTPVELQLIQNGNNLTLNRIGSNSLTSRMQFVQEGNYKTITIISN